MENKRLENIEQKIDGIKESIVNIDHTLVEQHHSLKAHMRRTDMLEKLVFITLAALGALGMILIKL